MFFVLSVSNTKFYLLFEKEAFLKNSNNNKKKKKKKKTRKKTKKKKQQQQKQKTTTNKQTMFLFIYDDVLVFPVDASDVDLSFSVVAFAFCFVDPEDEPGARDPQRDALSSSLNLEPVIIYR